MEIFAALEETEDRLGPTAAEASDGTGLSAARPRRRHMPELALALGCAAVLAALLASI